jgi:hypothetical protein
MRQEINDAGVCAVPDREPAPEQSSPRGHEPQQSAASILRIDHHVDEAASLERLERRGQGAPIHCEQRDNARHAGRFRPVQRLLQQEWPWVKPSVELSGPNASSKRRAAPARFEHGHRFALTLVYMRERALRRVMRFGHCALPGSVDQAFQFATGTIS